ncbi:MAG: preprotein translocase subunit SecE [Cyclobacteriaceae bacterium]
MNKLVNYIKASFEELTKRVTWPTYSELQSTTVLVVVATLIFSAVIFGMDKLFDLLVDIIYS